MFHFPKCYIGKSLYDLTMTNAAVQRDILADSEVLQMVDKANEIQDEYQRLRAKAIVGLLKKFGKRRIEIATLNIKDLEVKDGFLYVTFETVKKRKLGLYQYIKLLRKQNPSALNQNHSELEENWKQWRETETGQKTFKNRRTKRVEESDIYAQHIIVYWNYMKKRFQDSKFLFPSGRCLFGIDYVFDQKNHLSGRQLLNVVKSLDKTVWCHLFRETKGAEVARKEGMKLEAVYSVMLTLDLEKEQTAWNYVRRYAVQTIDSERKEKVEE